MIEKTEGVIKDVAGKVQDAVGGLTGDTGLQAEGKVRQAAGKVQQQYGDLIDSLRDSAVSAPLATIAISAAVGFAIGALWANRGD